MLKRVLRESRRENALHRQRGYDTTADHAYDRFVKRVAESFDAPFALVSVARGDRLWFKATLGVTLVSEQRCNTFCNYVLDTDVPLEVCDARAEPRFSALPAVTGDFAIRYYLGARLRLSSGVGVGALCILDKAVRPPASPDQRAFLQAIARQAAAVLELRASALIEHAG